MKLIGILLLVVGTVACHGHSFEESMIGHWQTACESDELGHLHVREGHGHLNVTYFESGSACDESMSTYEMDHHFDFVLGDEQDSFRHIDAAFLMISVTPHTDGIVQDFNNQAMAGITDWERAVERDVTGNTFKSVKVPGAGEIGLGVIALDGDHSSMLKLDVSEPGGTRPSDLSSAQVFHAFEHGSHGH